MEFFHGKGGLREMAVLGLPVLRTSVKTTSLHHQVLDIPFDDFRNLSSEIVECFLKSPHSHPKRMTKEISCDKNLSFQSWLFLDLGISIQFSFEEHKKQNHHEMQ